MKVREVFRESQIIVVEVKAKVFLPWRAKVLRTCTAISVILHTRKTLVLDSCSTPGQFSLEIGQLRHSEQNNKIIKKGKHINRNVFYESSVHSIVHSNKKCGFLCCHFLSSIEPKPVGHLKKSVYKVSNTHIGCELWIPEEEKSIR